MHTHVLPLRPDTLPLPRVPLPDLMRLQLRRLVLPDHDRVPERARVRDDARDVRPDVPQVRHEQPVRAVPEHLVGLRLHGRAAASGERERDLHPPADVEERVWHAQVLHELADREFLRGRDIERLVSENAGLLGVGAPAHLVVELTQPLRTGRRPVARNDALHADVFRRAEDLLLVVDDPRAHRADQDIDAREYLSELCRVVRDVSKPDLDPRCAKGLRLRLRNRCRTKEGSDALWRCSVISGFMRMHERCSRIRRTLVARRRYSAL